MPLKRGLSPIFYGTEGVGKTTLALEFPKPLLFLSVKENGFENLDLVGDIPEGCDNEEIETFPHLIQKLKKDAREYQTIVIDSISGVQQLVGADIIKTVYASKDNPEASFASFSEGFRVHGPMWVEKLTNELTLLNSRGITTVLIGHVKQETIKNPHGNDYNASVIDMESWPRAVLKKWASMIGFMTIEADIMVTKRWKQAVTESKVSGDPDDEAGRIMYTVKNLSHESKNMYHLPPVIQLGNSPKEAYKNLTDCFPAHIKEALQSK